MGRIRFATAAAADRVINDIDVTAYIEGGVGPVKLGRPALKSDGSAVIDHPFAAVDLEWVLAYANDPEVTIEK